MRKKIERIIVLGGGNDQISLIKELRNRFNNAYILLIDYYENPPAKPFANKHIKESTLNKEMVLKIATKIKADLVITAFTDQALLTMAYVSEKLGLDCYLTYEQALNLTNKKYMKKIMYENNIPTTRYKIISSQENIKIGNMNYPLVVKPVDNNSSKGITKVENINDLSKAIEHAFLYSRSKNIIVEEFFEGEEYSVDALILDGEPHIILSTKLIKVKENNSKFTILESIYPVDYSKEIELKLKKVIVDISRSFEIDNVPLLIQFLVNKDKINVVEFSARVGGGSKQHFIRELTGVNVIENLIDIILGQRPNIKKRERECFASMIYVYAYPGKFFGLKNIEELKNEKYINDYYYYKSIGMDIVNAEVSSDRVAGIFVTAESKDELIKKINIIDSRLRVLDESGNDIMIHGLY